MQKWVGLFQLQCPNLNGEMSLQENTDGNRDSNLQKNCPSLPKFSRDGAASKRRITFTIDEAIDKMGYGPFQFVLYIFCGIICMADSMELMILAILSPAVKCQWSLSKVEEAIITSSVFVGFLVGSTLWGYVSDNLGRKNAFIAMNILVLSSGVLSAVKLTPDDARIPGYPWLLVCRFLVGLGLAGSVQASTYYIEFLPKRTRAICTVFLIGWFAIGTMFGAALALAVLGNDRYSWHWYVGLSSIPTAITTVALLFFPKSARVQMSKGNTKEAIKVLRKIAWFNFTNLPPGELVLTAHNSWVSDEKVNKAGEKEQYTYLSYASEDVPLINAVKKEYPPVKIGLYQKTAMTFRKGLERLKFLFGSGMWKTTIPLWVLWFGAAWLYYGCVLLTTTMLKDDPHCDKSEYNSSLLVYLDYDNDNYSNFSNSSLCKELNSGDYVKILWTSAAELPGILVTVTIIETLGRKITMLIGFLIAMLGFCLLFKCTTDTVLTVFFFIIRAAISGLFQAMYVYTPEVYSTNIRGLGIGFASAWARVGSMSTPYVAQVLFYTSDYATIGIYAGMCLFLAFFVLLLPVETKGKALKE